MTSPFGGTKQNESLAVQDAQVDVPEWFTRYLRAATSRIGVQFNLSDDFPTWMADRIALLGLGIPIGQIIGYPLTAPQYDQTNSSDTTTSTTYADLSVANSGPALTGLPDGVYVVTFGAYLRNSTSSQQSLMSIQVNGTAASDDDLCGATVTEFHSVSVSVVKTLNTGGNNSITTKYRVGGGTGTFDHRWLLAIRQSNI